MAAVIHGPEKCPRPCSDCVDPGSAYAVGSGGPHHWLETCLDTGDITDDDRQDYPEQIAEGVDAFFACKHCPAWTRHLCSTCLDGEVLSDTCDDCNERHCPDCEPCDEASA